MQNGAQLSKISRSFSYSSEQLVWFTVLNVRYVSPAIYKTYSRYLCVSTHYDFYRSYKLNSPYNNWERRNKFTKSY